MGAEEKEYVGYERDKNPHFSSPKSFLCFSLFFLDLFAVSAQIVYCVRSDKSVLHGCVMVSGRVV